MINTLSNAYGKIPLVVKAPYCTRACGTRVIRALMTCDILPYMFDNSIICVTDITVNNSEYLQLADKKCFCLVLNSIMVYIHVTRPSHVSLLSVYFCRTSSFSHGLVPFLAVSVHGLPLIASNPSDEGKNRTFINQVKLLPVILSCSWRLKCKIMYHFGSI